MAVLTVAQINRYISFKIKEDRNLQGIMVKGEISNFTVHYRSGHLYFTLKDGEAAIKAVMFSSAASRLKFNVENGMSVIVSASVAVYERDGVYQLYVTDIQPDGTGAVYIAVEQLKAKLSKLGIFDNAHKRPLPVFPKKIGVVTSKSGAALKDIINVLSRRYPIGELYIVNALVQGENAPDSICRGILEAEKAECDVVIVGRGGGSIEDLSAFNSEKVAYAIYNCKAPVVSAVGHETDYTIADLAADLRAPTPSAAAELVSLSSEQLLEKTKMLEKRLENAVYKLFDGKSEQLIALNSRLLKFSPENNLKINNQKLCMLEKGLKNAITARLRNCEALLNSKMTALDVLSPVKVLSRGYSLVYNEEKLINNASQATIGDKLSIRTGNGSIIAEVTDIITED
ncbi:MAG: exodeoxyribonuclease VII large subunit [Ruminococcus sp.]|nr:exodeoxyribonuclease VII large subunit [Ruminococcus sp.]